MQRAPFDRGTHAGVCRLHTVPQGDTLTIQAWRGSTAGPVGSVQLKPAGSGLELSNLWVQEQHRRTGIASTLIEGAVNAARQRGASQVVLEARPGDGSMSPAALTSMYSRMGFHHLATSSRGNVIMQRKTGVAQRQSPATAAAIAARSASVLPHGRQVVQPMKRRHTEMIEPPSGLARLPDDVTLAIFEMFFVLESFAGRLFLLNPEEAQIWKLKAVCKKWKRILEARLPTHSTDLRLLQETITGINANLTKKTGRAVSLRLGIGGKKVGSNMNLLPENDAIGIHHLARTILAEYPPDQNIFISVGSSPSAITLYLKCAAPTVQMFHFPLSSVTKEIIENAGPARENLLKYADTCLGTLNPGHRNLVLVDIVAEGHALRGMQYLLSLYMEWRDQKGGFASPWTGEIVMLALNATDPRKFGIKVLPHRTTQSAGVQNSILGKEYKEELMLRLYGRHEIESVLSGLLLCPAADIGLTYRLLILVRRLRIFMRQHMREFPFVADVDSPWEYDPDDRAWM